MKRYFAVLLVLFSFYACSNDKEEPEKVYIRLSNISSYNFSNVVVNTGGGMVNYGDVASSARTEYEAFDSAFRYAFIELQIEEETYTIQPIDYMGEKPLENGYYTYALNANDSDDRFGRLILRLIED